MWHLFGHHIQQCCMRACAAAIGIHGDGLFIASIFSLPCQFKLQNGERAKSWISERRKNMQSLLELLALLLFKTLRGMAPMYLQDLLQVKTPGRYSLRSDALGLHKVPHTCMVQDLWGPRICCCSSQILGQPFSCHQRE